MRARSIQNWEAGDVIPYRNFAKLEEALGRSVTWFLRGMEEELDRPRLEALIERLARIVERLEEVPSPQR